ncbi:MAG: hypothetical protein K8I27_08165 [Planctomycetes bacterium]|nr:hypothetical protein [Planctomycetota bacterium]
MTAKGSIRKASRAKRSFDRGVQAFAWYTGWVGFGLLVVCGLLWLVPGESWDGMFALKARRLPSYTLVALLMASLLGWRLVNLGEDRLKRNFGRHVNLALFVIVPLACILSELLQRQLTNATGMQAPDHAFWLFVRWYPIALICVSAAVFLMWKSRPRKRVYFDRGVGYVILLTPYALLFAFLELGLRMDWLDTHLRETFSAAGQYTIALQLITAYFIGGD